MLRASEMTQGVKAPATKTHDLSWILRAQAVEGERAPTSKRCALTSKHPGTCASPQTDRQTIP